VLLGRGARSILRCAAVVVAEVAHDRTMVAGGVDGGVDVADLLEGLDERAVEGGEVDAVGGEHHLDAGRCPVAGAALGPVAGIFPSHPVQLHRRYTANLIFLEIGANVVLDLR
jgi:hypothetical protein